MPLPVKKLPDFDFPVDLAEKGNHMTRAYFVLYCLENFLRLFIEKVGKENFGENYWDHLKLHRLIEKKVESRKEGEKKQKWLSLRGQSNVFYLDFEEIRSIIQNNWNLFELFFPSQDWIRTRLIDLYNIRNLIAHNSYININEQQTLETFAKNIYTQLEFKLNIQIPKNAIAPQLMKEESSLKKNGFESPKLDLFFLNHKKDLEISLGDPAPLDFAIILDEQQKMQDISKNEIEMYHIKAREYNETLKNWKSYKEVEFLITNTGDANATDVDVLINCHVDKDVDLLIESEYENNEPTKPTIPQPPLRTFICPPLNSINPLLNSPVQDLEPYNTRYYEIEKVEKGQYNLWQFGYNIKKVRREEIVLNYPLYILIPNLKNPVTITLSVEIKCDQCKTTQVEPLILTFKT